MRADPGRQDRQVLVVPLHPGHREDRRHHADHTAKLVEIKGLVQQVIPAHHLDELDETIGPFHKLVQITECIDHDVKTDQRDITREVGLDKRPVPLAIEDSHVSTPIARRSVFGSDPMNLASMPDDLGINPH